MAAEQDIPSGTLLDNRYLVQRVLGRGGFGRTYLALNQRRWGEPCVLKEFVPSVTDEYVVTKSRELFEREAKTLYKLEHPQIPEFLDVFEEDERQFLVQQYVEGKNYHQLLRERQRFTPVEVLQWLRDLLPVLDYIHSQNIIHRDISPDNIILPAHSSRPVLIDFGVVKETVTQLFARYTFNGAAQASAVVGKTGYAAPEQLRTGECYPSSDLYSLGVTAVVLLTGNLEPNTLFDGFNEEWRWEQYVTLGPEFKAVLDKMMASRPKNRYRMATEVLTDLAALTLESEVRTTAATPTAIEPGVISLNNSELVTEVNSVLQGALSIGWIESLPGVATAPEAEVEVTTALEAVGVNALKESAPASGTSLPPTPLSPLPLQLDLSFQVAETPVSRFPVPATPVNPLPARTPIQELNFPDIPTVVALSAGNQTTASLPPQPLLRLPRIAIVTSLALGLTGTGLAIHSPQLPGLCQSLNNCAKNSQVNVKVQPLLKSYGQALDPLQELKTLVALDETATAATKLLGNNDQVLQSLSVEALESRLEAMKKVQATLQGTVLNKLQELPESPWLKQWVKVAQQRHESEVKRTASLMNQIEQKIQEKTKASEPPAPPAYEEPTPVFSDPVYVPPAPSTYAPPAPASPPQPSVPASGGNCPGNQC